MESINQFLNTVVGYVWGLPLVFTLIGIGVFFTFALGGIQLKGFVHAIKVIMGRYTDPNDPGQITHFQALCTALSATVGLGNIAGVAVAMHLGGPGATFWMILAGFLGMATKFVECSLGLMYRRFDAKGQVQGGAMYYIELGLGKKWKPMALFFAFACLMASFGASNMFQTNQVAAIFDSTFGVPKLATGIILAVLTGVVIIGGIQRIGQVTSILVPIMGGIYILGSLVVIFTNLPKVPELLYAIVHDAFSGTAAIGGMVGISVREGLVQGIRRAVFSNEAGLGSAPIAHSAASTKEPIREGTVALLEPFVDTVVICTMTALVILISGAWSLDKTGVELTAIAFDTAIPGFGKWFVPVAVFLFAYSTLLSWSYYGERATQYLLGDKAILPYKIIFCIFAIIGATWSLDPVIAFSDTMLGLMVVPNVIAMILLFPRVRAASKIYFDKLNRGEFQTYTKK